jgi:hypothetical protein
LNPGLQHKASQISVQTTKKPSARQQKARAKRAFCKGSDQLLGWHLLGWLFAFLWFCGCVVHNVLSGGWLNSNDASLAQ